MSNETKNDRRVAQDIVVELTLIAIIEALDNATAGRAARLLASPRLKGGIDQSAASEGIRAAAHRLIEQNIAALKREAS